MMRTVTIRSPMSAVAAPLNDSLAAEFFDRVIIVKPAFRLFEVRGPGRTILALNVDTSAGGGARVGLFDAGVEQRG